MRGDKSKSQLLRDRGWDEIEDGVWSHWAHPDETESFERALSIAGIDPDEPLDSDTLATGHTPSEHARWEEVCRVLPVLRGPAPLTREELGELRRQLEAAGPEGPDPDLLPQLPKRKPNPTPGSASRLVRRLKF